MGILEDLFGPMARGSAGLGSTSAPQQADFERMQGLGSSRAVPGEAATVADLRKRSKGY